MPGTVWGLFPTKYCLLILKSMLSGATFISKVGHVILTSLIKLVTVAGYCLMVNTKCLLVRYSPYSFLILSISQCYSSFTCIFRCFRTKLSLKVTKKFQYLVWIYQFIIKNFIVICICMQDFFHLRVLQLFCQKI